MTTSPIVWGVGLAFALGGAIAGNAVGSISVTDRSAFGSFYQSHETTSSDHDAQGLPDHYPLVTQNGVVPVEELSDRGLFSQRRYRPVVAVASYVESGQDDPGPGFDEAEVTGAQPEGDRAEPPPPAQTDGEAKLIDVSATLAMR